MNKSPIQVGDTVVIMVEYHLLHNCKVLKINKKSIKVDVPVGAIHGWVAHTRLVKPKRVVKYGDPLCIVWEQWKSKSVVVYRFEHTLYSQYHRPVETWFNGFYSGKQTPSYIEEPQYGVFGQAV